MRLKGREGYWGLLACFACGGRFLRSEFGVNGELMCSFRVAPSASRPKAVGVGEVGRAGSGRIGAGWLSGAWVGEVGQGDWGGVLTGVNRSGIIWAVVQ
jgi:hypothetical protein